MYIIIRHKHQGGDNMYKAYKFRLYHNTNQKILINKTFGCVRFVYIYFLNECRKEGYQNLLICVKH